MNKAHKTKLIRTLKNALALIQRKGWMRGYYGSAYKEADIQYLVLPIGGGERYVHADGVPLTDTPAQCNCFCMHGALAAVTTNWKFTNDSGGLIHSEANNLLAAAIPELYPEYDNLRDIDSRYVHVPHFNDDVRTTKERVVAVFEHAIAKLEAKP